VFHLSNFTASQGLSLIMHRQRLKNDQFPVYLGVTLDQSNTCTRAHDKDSWQAWKQELFLFRWPVHHGIPTTNVSTLSTSALADCVTQLQSNCSLTWARSTCTRPVNCQLNNSMQPMSGTLRPSQLPWLSVLANIAPPELRPKVVSDGFLNEVLDYP